MARSRDISRLITTPPSIYTTDGELSSGGYLTNSSASAIYATIESVGEGSAGGLTLINTTSFSAVSAASFPDGTFSSTYKNYRILVNMTGAGGTLYGRLRVGGSDNTSSVYQIQRLEASGSSTPSAYNSGNTNVWDDFGNIRTIPRPISADLFQPFEATPTSFSHVVITGTAATLMSVVGYHSASTSFDSFSIIASSGTITGTMSAYGYEI
jgi:hypothetical protein